MTKQVLILGATGRIGRHSVHAFEQAGWTVRRFNRKSDNMAQAARGCDVIVNGLNPQNYHNWKEIIPSITADVIDAAQQSGATVILPGNVYHFGDQGGVWSEHTQPNPVSRKGEIRLTMERDYARSGVQTIVLRGGNFIDPDLEGCVMATVYLRDIKRNRIALPGAPDVRQAVCYLPDWARAAVLLAEKRNELSQFEDIPLEGHTLSALDIKTEAERILGRDLKFAPFPWRLLALTSPFWELARELKEMRYLWNTDHALSNDRLAELLPEFRRTPFHEVMRTILPH